MNSFSLFSQGNEVKMDVILFPESNSLLIEQKTNFYNNTNKTLNSVFFHNWPNAFKDNETPLAKRIVENYSKSFHFTIERNRGKTNIFEMSIEGEPTKWNEFNNNQDFLEVVLIKPLKPGESVTISTTYEVIIPNDKFTKYGRDKENFNLRYWFLSPAIYENGWKLYHHLDLDDLYVDFTDYDITFTTPKDYYLATDLDKFIIDNPTNIRYRLLGKKEQDVEIVLYKDGNYKTYYTHDLAVTTNLNGKGLADQLLTDILNRELAFLKDYLGDFNQKHLLINSVSYDKNPVYGFNQLPTFLTPFTESFEWDIKMFKVLSEKYIEQLFLINKREDHWLSDALHTYLMIKYVEKFYPEMKAVGEISKMWGIKSFKLAKIDFNDKYAFVNQFATRKNLDQALATPIDSLSNFNRKIVNKYKAGLGLRYLEEYLGEQVVFEAIKNYSNDFRNKKLNSENFSKYLKTEKNLKWFFKDFVQTNKKIDYTIKKIHKTKDSIHVTIKNKRKIAPPVKIYGIKDKEIKFEQWIEGIDSISTITVPQNGFDRLSLNYEGHLPENNLRNNWKNVQPKLLNKPLLMRFFMDIEDPNYNQLFYIPTFSYNYYDGVILGMALTNKTIINKNFEYKVTPSYGFKSNSLSGSYSFIYQYLPENKKVDRFAIGVAGSNFNYAPDLSYNSFSASTSVLFKRKNLRDVTARGISASFIAIDKEIDPNQIAHPETNKYNVLSLGYGYSRPGILTDLRYRANLQLADKFSKISATARYRKLTNTNTQFDVRWFGGIFLRNNTDTDYFSFALDRPTDYLFQYEYLGRSEDTGFFSQQVIINEGGFKSQLEVPFANQWLTSLNMSVGLWRWAEIYGDIGLLKNKGMNPYFAYDSGVRFNFIQDILEVYFPVHSNLGWEIAEPRYIEKIRFVLVIRPKRIFNFIRRGFY